VALALKYDERYTYADYLTWDTDERYEMIDGVPYLMAPGPTPAHQRAVLEIGTQFKQFLAGKPCEVFLAPLDVRLNADEADDTFVQPDILVVCDASKIDERGVKGAPDLVVEVHSPSSANYDGVLKLNRYMAVGVKECWLVDTQSGIIRVHINKGNGKEEQSIYTWDENIPVGIFPGFSVVMGDVKASVEGKS
jgi:Uma2 family endonuclease